MPATEPVKKQIKRVVIWDAGGAVTAYKNYAQVLEERFEELGYSTLTRNLVNYGGTSVTANNADLHVIGGGITSVNSEAHWLEGGKGIVSWLIKKAQEGDIQLLGLGFGAQIIADSLKPGSVIKSEDFNAGLKEIVWKQGFRTPQPVFHYEEIDGNVFDSDFESTTAWVDKGDYLTLQAFADRENNIYGTQFHPELSVTDLYSLINNDSLDELGAVIPYSAAKEDIEAMVKRTAYSQPRAFKETLIRLGLKL